jgi:hypothetical protein
LLTEAVSANRAEVKRKNPHAVKAGKAGKGKPKRMTPAALKQRKNAARKPRKKGVKVSFSFEPK